ncbi:hypothetical protein, partial [Vibrio crassostreae]|uniref:hypothetical protein n=2 Tax=Vibrio crassostreae TaxID=246167 RepID=UPI001BD4E746
ITPAPSARLLITLLDMDYKPNTLATALFLNRYNLTVGNINLGTAISRTKWPIVSFFEQICLFQSVAIYPDIAHRTEVFF